MALDYEIEAKFLLRDAGIKVDTELRESNIFLTNILRCHNIRYQEVLLPGGFDGAFFRSTDNDPHWIFINKEQVPVRRRFSCGHEIGHYWLGHHSDVSLLSEREKWQEVQANRFSSALLMPRDAFFCVHCRLSTIREVARWFRVAEIVAAIRMHELDLRREESRIVIREYRMHYQH